MSRAYRELGEEGFTIRAYQRWRAQQIELDDEPIPSDDQLAALFGSFTEAAHRAIPDLPRRRLRLAGPKRVADQERAARAGAPASAVTETEHRGDAAPETRAPETSGAAGARSNDDRSDDAVEPKRLLLLERTAAAPSRRHEEAAAPPGSAVSAARLDVLLAMARELSPDELRVIERHARRRLERCPTPAARRRVERLSFLARLLDEEPSLVVPFRVVERKRYDEQRPAASPTSERLVRAYGSWAAACRAAAGVRADGRKSAAGTVAGGIKHGRKGAPYTRGDVIRAVQRCALDIGRSPSSRDFHAWSIETRARARARGQTLRLPGYWTICRLFRAEARAKGLPSVWAVVNAAVGAASTNM